MRGLDGGLFIEPLRRNNSPTRNNHRWNENNGRQENSRNDQPLNFGSNSLELNNLRGTNCAPDSPELKTRGLLPERELRGLSTDTKARSNSQKLDSLNYGTSKDDLLELQRPEAWDLTRGATARLSGDSRLKTNNSTSAESLSLCLAGSPETKFRSRARLKLAPLSLNHRTNTNLWSPKKRHLPKGLREDNSTDTKPQSPAGSKKTKPQSPAESGKTKPQSPEGSGKTKPQSPTGSEKTKPQSPAESGKTKPQSPELKQQRLDGNKTNNSKPKHSLSDKSKTNPSWYHESKTNVSQQDESKTNSRRQTQSWNQRLNKSELKQRWLAKSKPNLRRLDESETK